MNRDLPFFKFFPDRWLTGDITLEEMELQGVFINVCATYWANECKMEMDKLNKRYGEAIARLLKSGLIKDKNGIANISFLDAQFKGLSKTHSINSANGKKGAEKRWGSHSDPIAFRKEKKRKEKIDIKKDCLELIPTYGKEMIDNFLRYWQEKNNKGIEKWELQKTWETKRRLETWKRNDFGSKKPVQKTNGQNGVIL